MQCFPIAPLQYLHLFQNSPIIRNKFHKPVDKSGPEIRSLENILLLSSGVEFKFVVNNKFHDAETFFYSVLHGESAMSK